MNVKTVECCSALRIRSVPDTSPHTTATATNQFGYGSAEYVMFYRSGGCWSNGLDPDFAGPLQLTLQAVEGPGHFALFFQDPFGQPIPGMNSRDGLDGDDTLAVPLGSHLHCNWAFSAPGRYRLRFVATGTLRAGSTPIASAPTDWFFDVVAPPPPVLTLTRAPGDTLQLALEAQPGLNYALEHTATFADWTLLTNLHASVALTLHLLPADPEPTRFLRARLNTEEVQQEANGTFLTEHP